MAYGHSLLLDAEWDIQLDASGNIAVTTGDYAVAQNVSNAVRLFTDDAYYDPDRGIPHFAITLGRKPSMSVFRAVVRQAALGVDGVKAADVKDITLVRTDTQSPDGSSVTPRTLTGDIRLTMEDGETYGISI
jgi:hypothetical protein